MTLFALLVLSIYVYMCKFRRFRYGFNVGCPVPKLISLEVERVKLDVYRLGGMKFLQH